MPRPEVYQKSEAQISVDGKVLGNLFTFAGLKVTHAINRIPTAIVRIYDGEEPTENFALSSGDAPALVPGAKVKISFRIPESGKVIPVFEGILLSQHIRLFQDRSLLILECKDPAFKMTIGKSFAGFSEKKDSEILEQMIKKHGLTAEVKATKVKHAALMQYDVCDWDFMMMRAEANGMIVSVKQGKVALAPPDFSQKEPLDLSYDDNLLQVDLKVDARAQLAQASALSWDPKKQEVVQEEVKDAETKVPDSPGNLTAKKLSQALSDPHYSLVHPGNLPKDQLKTWAQARMLKSRMARMQGHVTTYGMDIDPGKTIELKALGERFSGAAFITGVTHELIGGDWRTKLEFGLPDQWYTDAFHQGESGASNHHPFAGLTTAKVVKIEGDPESEFRVQVRLWFGEKGSLVWARLAFPDAGPDHGLIHWPEIDDEVVVGFMGGDAVYPVVLGYLFSSKSEPAIKPEKKNNKKGIVTRSGIQLLFDDDEKSVNLETPGGYQVSINEKEKTLLCKDGNNNRVTLSSSGIALESAKKIELSSKDKIVLSGAKGVDIKASMGDLDLQGSNIKNAAKMKFSAKGNSGAELTTPAIATLKGSLVQIN